MTGQPLPRGFRGSLSQVLQEWRVCSCRTVNHVADGPEPKKNTTWRADPPSQPAPSPAALHDRRWPRGQGAGYLSVDLAPPVKSPLVEAAQRRTRQPLSDPRRPRPMEAARAGQLAAQHLGRRPQRTRAGCPPRPVSLSPQTSGPPRPEHPADSATRQPRRAAATPRPPPTAPVPPPPEPDARHAADPAPVHRWPPAHAVTPTSTVTPLV